VTTLAQLRAQLRTHGAGPAHETAALRAWLQGRPFEAGHAHPGDFFPARFRAALPELQAFRDGLGLVHSVHPAGDGSTRLLVRLADGQTVESVLLPRHGVCVSTQVGCAVGCTFCMTGREGVKRQLGSAEIAAQVALARARGHVVRKVVFMGMGEPSHNLDNVLEAIDALGTTGGIAHKNLVFSTVGDRRAFERLPRGTVKPALAVSLHTTKSDLRAELLPRAPRIEPAELVSLAGAYADATGYPVQYQWTLLEGVNDGDDEIEAIAGLLAGQYAVMNFIPFNRIPGSVHRRPDMAQAARMVRELHRRGVLAKLRYSAGQDVEGGCGQLRARSQGAS
jgi:23S rRNA (adenine2503-C2)-methyltransferase